LSPPTKPITTEYGYTSKSERLYFIFMYFYVILQNMLFKKKRIPYLALYTATLVYL
jgi:hypothetical protein